MLVSGCSGYLDATTVGCRAGLPTFKGRYDGRYSTSSTKLAFGVVLVGISQCISCIFESCVYPKGSWLTLLDDDWGVKSPPLERYLGSITTLRR